MESVRSELQAREQALAEAHGVWRSARKPLRRRG